MSRTVYLGIRVTPEQYEFLENYCRVNNVKMSVAVRKAISYFMDNYSVEVQNMNAKLDRIDMKLDLIIKALGDLHGHSN